MIKNRLTKRWDGFLLLIKAFPHGEGGSCVPRKHETDEGIFSNSVGSAATSPEREPRGDIDGSRKYREIVTGGNPWKGPHQRHFFRKGLGCYPADRPHRLSQE